MSAVAIAARGKNVERITHLSPILSIHNPSGHDAFTISVARQAVNYTSDCKQHRNYRSSLEEKTKKWEIEILAVYDQARFSRADSAYALIKDLVFSGGRLISTREGIDTVRCGKITFGSELPPVEVYQGPTGRRALKGNPTATVAVGSGSDQTLPGPM